MTDPQARRLFEFLLSEDLDTIDCEHVHEAIQRYVDLKVAGLRADVLMPGVAAHLDECGECHHMYTALADLAHHEAADELPDIDGLWGELAALGGLTGRAAAGQAIAAGMRPDRLVPAPSRASLDAATGHAADPPRRRWDEIFRRPAGLALLATCLALVVLAAGWWRSADDAGDAADVLDVAAAASELRQAQGQTGASATVYFQPSSDEAAVHVEGFPALKAGERIECWLKKRLSGQAKLAGSWKVSSDSDWWVIDADQPLQDFQAMTLTVGNGSASEPVLEVPLDEDSR